MANNNDRGHYKTHSVGKKRQGATPTLFSWRAMFPLRLPISRLRPTARLPF